VRWGFRRSLIHGALADAWAVYDKCGRHTEIGEARTMKKAEPTPETKRFYAAVASSLRRAARRARETARMHGTPLYVWQNGKVVAKKP
jgi:hypothetical protein